MKNSAPIVLRTSGFVPIAELFQLDSEAFNHLDNWAVVLDYERVNSV